MAIDTNVPMVVDGEERKRAAGGVIDLVDPSTGDRIGTAPLASPGDIDEAVAAAKRAFEQHWADSLPAERGRLMIGLAAAIRENARELAEVVMRNTGHPAAFALGDAENAARYFEYYGGLADKIQGDSIPLGPERVDFTLREPWGVCGIITPFNGPLQMLGRSGAPAIAAGNTVVLKPTEQAPAAALALARLLNASGMPPGVFNVLPGAADSGQRLVSNPDVRHVTFTGSVPTGTAIMKSAAEQITPVVLELGGKSPQVIFEDADLDAVTTAIVGSALVTAGQVCSAGTRILVQRSVRDDLIERLKVAAEGISIGPPIEGADMGPLISARQQERVLGAIRSARTSGARLVTGGDVPIKDAPAGGFFVRPTLFDQVDPASELSRQEIFGPVLAVMSFHDWQEALALANDTEFGLVAGVWTRDIGRALHFARQLQVGQVFVNNFGAGGGIELPFGGYKKSGIGREKGVAAIYDYTQVKNVCVLVDPR